ncbi:hypothetical protein ACGFIF_43160 [Kribbella sp. NPDC049174]|uniref:hypothetical protein n=1 Tax=Kribbella sp. NPDC049174 TaxID=3364112 RepID=UPI003723E50E
MIGPSARLALGYLRQYPLMSADELGRCQQRMAETAKTRGLVLGTVHVEALPTETQAFEQLLAAVGSLDVAAVIVPTPIHVGARDDRGSRWNRIRLETGVEVLFTDPGP